MRKSRDIIKFKDNHWVYSKGIFEKCISKKGIKISLLKLMPGAVIKKHKHTNTRYSFVIKGKMSDERGNYSRGDLMITRKGYIHSVIAGKKGCEFFVVWN